MKPRPIEFLLNATEIETRLAPGVVLLDFIRERRRLTGTKIGCREGDCGACTVLVGEPAGDGVAYRSMTSCLVPLGNVRGKHVVTVEGLNLAGLSPVQDAVVEAGGTQCGFCTVGFVVSLTGFCLRPEPPTPAGAVAAMDGNICRCTGYKSLERAGAQVVHALTRARAGGDLSALVDGGFLPPYFTSVAARLKRMRRPVSPPANGTTVRVVGGGTDLYVQQPETLPAAAVELVFDREPLKGIERSDESIRIGGATTTQELLESQLLRERFPGWTGYLELVSSTPIRNMATVAGNFVNASPIGDLSILFLALDAELTLQGPAGSRTVALREFFLDYKKIDRKPEEVVAALTVPDPAADAAFNFEKVSKRTYLDIASVNSAAGFAVRDGVIARASLSAGGVAPVPKYLARTSAFLTGRTVDPATVKEAAALADEEIAPISDARGSREYKRLLLRQLIYAHFLACFPGAVRFEALT